MRSLLGLALALCGCQLLPQKEVLCNESGRCDPVVAAPFVLGQGSERSNWWSTGMSTPLGAAITPDGKLLVVDHDQNRVLIWNTFPTANDQPADICLGQTDPSLPPAGGTDYFSNGAVGGPTRLSTDGTKLLVYSDTASPSSGVTFILNRLLGWNQIPTASKASPSFSISGTTGTCATCFQTGGPLLVSNKLYFSDRSSHRVLYWSTLPTSSVGASAALGQMDVMSGAANSGGLSQTSLNAPDGSPASDGTRLFVADTSNHRVLFWNSLPSASNAPADGVLGQSGFAANQANQGMPAPSLSTLAGPIAVAVAGGKVAVADRGNHRVLLWSQLPTAAGTPANVVLGQADAAGNMANSGGVSGARMSAPESVATDGDRLVVTDRGNHRVLIWSHWPTASGAPADLILGQTEPTNNVPRGIVVSASRFLAPVAMTRVGNSFVVVDRDAHRALVYPHLPVAPSDAPSIVLGQPNFTARDNNIGGISANSMSSPQGATSDGKFLAIADTGNHRIQIWRTLPTQNQQPADVFLGQLNMATAVVNSGGAATGLSSPVDVFSAGGRLYVADTGNHRVLIWKTIPAQNQQPPDLVLGQADLIGITAYRGGTKPTASTLKSPQGVYADETSIYVSDTGSNRVLIWNTLDPANGQAADVVLGQADFTTDAAAGSVSELAITSPRGLGVTKGRLYAVDSANHRIIYWSAIPTQKGQPAVGVIGQPTLSVGGPNSGGLKVLRFYNPIGMLLTEAGLYVADSGNSRVVAMPPLE